MTNTPFDITYYYRYIKKQGAGLLGEGARFSFYKTMISIIQRLISTPRVIVDIGCGVGYMSRYLSQLKCNPLVISTDFSVDGIKIAQRALADCPNVTVYRSDAQKIPLTKETADVIVAFDVIEHLPEPELFFSEAYRIMKPKGILVISTPNPWSFGCRVKGHYPAWSGKSQEERIWEWFGYRDDTHINIRTIDEWRKLFQKTGFTRVRDGTDFLWDTPYIKGIPILAQKIAFNGSHRLLTLIFGFLPWQWGENYVAIFSKP